MLNILNALEEIEKQHAAFLQLPKKIENAAFYAALFTISREIFSALKNTLIYQTLNFMDFKNCNEAEMEANRVIEANKIRELLERQIVNNIHLNDDNLEFRELISYLKNADSQLNKEIEPKKSLKEIMEKYAEGITVDEIILIFCGLRSVSAKNSTALKNRINKIMQGCNVTDELASKKFAHLIAYKTQLNETDSGSITKPEYEHLFNFILLTIKHIEYFFQNIQVKDLRYFVTFDTFYCDISLLKDQNIINELKRLFEINSKILKKVTEYKSSGISQIEVKPRLLNMGFTSEDIKFYDRIQNSNLFNYAKKIDIVNKEKFAERLKAALNASFDGDQTKLAKALSWKKTTLNSYFGPIEKIPNSFKSILADYLGVTNDYLAGLTDHPNAFMNHESNESLTKFYRHTPTYFNYNYQISSVYEELRNSLLSLPDPFKNIADLFSLERNGLNNLNGINILEQRLKKYPNPQFVWDRINEYGNNLNEDKITKCITIIEKFKSEHKEDYQQAQKGLNDLEEAFVNIYKNKIEQPYNNLSAALVDLLKEVDEIICESKEK